jgi:GTP-binding protein HflX
LPHHLIESFKSTLDEVREADLLLHVVDIAHPFHDNQIEVVMKTLQEIGASNIPVILVLNKIDLFRAKNPEANLDEMKGYYREQGFSDVIFVSATANENITQLKQLLSERVKQRHIQIFPNYLKDGYDFSPWATETT